MSREQYPTGGDVEAFLAQAGLTSGGLDVNGAAQAGREAFESATDRRFLAVAGMREFDPPVAASGVLELGTDLLSVTSVTYGGVTWTAGTEYRLLPANAAAEGRPYRCLALNRRWAAPLPFSLQGAIQITGSWGYGARIPEEVWEAMRATAALTLLPAISRGLTGGLVSWSDADVHEQYGEDPLSTLTSVWGTIRDSAVTRYRRVAVG